MAINGVFRVSFAAIWQKRRIAGLEFKFCLKLLLMAIIY
jgi:hypothetical protein